MNEYGHIIMNIEQILKNKGICYYLECNIEELVTYIPPQETK